MTAEEWCSFVLTTEESLQKLWLEIPANHWNHLRFHLLWGTIGKRESIDISFVSRLSDKIFPLSTNEKKICLTLATYDWLTTIHFRIKELTPNSEMHDLKKMKIKVVLYPQIQLSRNMKMQHLLQFSCKTFKLRNLHTCIPGRRGEGTPRSAGWGRADGFPKKCAWSLRAD